VLAAARPNLSNEETKKPEEITMYEYISPTKTSYYGRTDRMYHHIETGDVRPIRQHPRRLLLSKQAEVGRMLEDMQQRRVIEE
jgi:hypothetical protein